MKTWLVLSSLLLGVAAPGQLTIPGANALRSVSGQFVIFDRDNLPSAASAGVLSPPSPDTLELSPSVLLVSCERIKQAICLELNAGRDWTDNIYLHIRATREPVAPQIKIEELGRHWVYRVEFPDRIEKEQFVRTVVQVVLLEMANRSGRRRSAEIPVWLSEGIAQRLLASQELELVLPKPTANIRSIAISATTLRRRDPDPLAAARKILQENPAATLEELSWPKPDTFSPEQTRVFQASAQLLVTELLDLPNGTDLLRRFVLKLDRYYNWQLALQDVYQSQFPSQLAFAKWWTLQAATFVGRDHKQAWTVAESAGQLDAVLHATVAVRTRNGELPVRQEVSLQRVIKEWNTVQQMVLLPGKLRELERLQLRLAPQFILLAQEYHAAIKDYIRKRELSTTTFADVYNLPPSIQRVALDAVNQLDQLDRRRRALEKADQVTVSSEAKIQIVK